MKLSGQMPTVDVATVRVFGAASGFDLSFFSCKGLLLLKIE
jgi:hypothetical protein